MQPVSSANQGKRRLIKHDTPESSSDSEQAPDVLPIERLVRVEESVPSKQKSRRERPKKVRFETVPVEISPIESSSAVSVATVSTSVGTFQQIDEVVLALRNILKNKRPSTELAFRMPLASWKEYCDSLDAGRFADDMLHPYTVGPSEKVIAFFNECVFKKTYTKHVTIGADVRTQISLRDDENPGLSTRLTELTQNAPINKSGRGKKLQIPIGIESVNQYKKALMALHEFQVATRRITWPSPKISKELKSLIKQYGENLVYDQVQTNADRAAHCIIRDSYRIGQFIKILLDLWCSSDKFNLRERFSISARHHMLLRDQDLRNLNYSDCFFNIVPRAQHRGVQQAVALIFCLDKGKTLKDGEVKFASAMRHQNLYRCPFSAFTFYMFSKLQEKPSFLDNERWHNFKVLVDREECISGVQQYNATKKIFLKYGIHTSRVTHGGRHAGAMEAEALGIPLDVIKRGGGWKDRLGRLETHYLGKVPSEFARGMSGVWNKPFGLARNRVDPPIELQQRIFPWIENYFGEKNDEWKKECLDEMNQVDENEFREEVNEAEFIEESAGGELVLRKNQQQQQQTAIVHQTIDAAKRGFLKLLIRCRRVILQDAAVYLSLKKENQTVNTFPSSNNLFLSSPFQSFQELVEFAINTPNNDRLQEYESLVPHIVDSQNEVSSRLAGFDHQLSQVQRQIQQDTRQEIIQLKQQSHANQQDVSRKIGHLEQHLQQSLNMQQLILNHLQFLTNQRIESFVATSSAPISLGSALPPPSITPYLPSVPTTSAPSRSTSLPSVPSSTRTILPTPIQTVNNDSTIVTASTTTKRKYKKKEKATKWVNYSLE